MGKIDVEALRTPPSVLCLFPTQCGVGVDCSACLSQELARRSDSIKQLIEHIDTLTAELESLKRQVPEGWWQLPDTSFSPDEILMSGITPKDAQELVFHMAELASAAKEEGK